MEAYVQDNDCNPHEGKTEMPYSKRHVNITKKLTRRPLLALTLTLIMWTDGYLGERIGEADNPGHGKRGPTEHNQRATPK